MHGARSRTLGAALVGRSFVHPAFDYLLIGGGLSLVVTAVVLWRGDAQLVAVTAVPFFILFSNSAHFAASTVRLYTKPNARESLPFLTMMFPVVSLAVLTLCMVQPEALGRHLHALYLTWSPYHYAAQSYGLAVMYTYRAGCALSDSNKRLLRGVAMLPFVHNFLVVDQAGLGWLAPDGVQSMAAVQAGVGWVRVGLPWFSLGALGFLSLKVWRSESGPMPLIALLAVFTNGVWFFALGADGFLWATVFHGIQYLAIVIIFHVKDRMRAPGNRRSPLFHIVWFYGACLALGYVLFQCMPMAYAFAGFGMVESVLLVVAAINLHHFIVDQHIWRMRKGDSNRGVVSESVQGQVVTA